MTRFEPFRHCRISASALRAAVCLGLAGGNLALAADVQVYECVQNGQKTFSSQPCAGEERKLDVQFDQPNPAAQAANAAALQQADAVAEANLLDNQILAAQQQVAQLGTERAATVAQINQEIWKGTEQLNADAWKAQKEAEAASVYQNYSNQIQAAQDRLNMLLARRAALNSSTPFRE